VYISNIQIKSILSSLLNLSKSSNLICILYLYLIHNAMGWLVRGLNPGGGEIFHTYPDQLWGPPSLLYSGYQVFPGGKERPGHDTDPSPPSSAVVMKG
jgi:hypothetical protein